MAVMFHETWKPTAYDDDLHRRMGTSYATHTFNVVRVALRREMVLAYGREPGVDFRLEILAAVGSVYDDGRTVLYLSAPLDRLVK